MLLHVGKKEEAVTSGKKYGYIRASSRDQNPDRQKESRSQRQMGFGLDAGRTNFLKNLICILRCGKREKSPSEKQQRFWKSALLPFIENVRS